MHQKIDNIKIVKLINGDDIVTSMPTGENQLKDDSPLLRLDKPLQIKYVPQITPLGFRDYIALIRWTNYTNDHVVTIPKDKILTITRASNEMTKAYGELVTKYDNMDKPKRDDKLVEKIKMSAEQNKKLNEIFEEFEDGPKFEDEEDEPPTIH